MFKLVPYVTFASAQVPCSILQLLRAERGAMTVLFYCSLQTSAAALPSRLVAGWRVLKRAISALTNKLNKYWGEKGNYGSFLLI